MYFLNGWNGSGSTEISKSNFLKAVTDGEPCFHIAVGAGFEALDVYTVGAANVQEAEEIFLEFTRSKWPEGEGWNTFNDENEPEIRLARPITSVEQVTDSNTGEAV